MFNVFCPFVSAFSSMETSVFLFNFITICITIMLFFINTNFVYQKKSSSYLLFPDVFSKYNFMVCFMMLMSLNLISLMLYGYPTTTTLSFNLMAALLFWFSSIMFLVKKPYGVSALLPQSSPWYLIPFLIIIELVSISVRPITLCFRLLANMSAGHILLVLICKASFVWLVGIMFSVLELVVSVVQAFVFVMLVKVYLDETVSH